MSSSDQAAFARVIANLRAIRESRAGGSESATHPAVALSRASLTETRPVSTQIADAGEMSAPAGLASACARKSESRYGRPLLAHRTPLPAPQVRLAGPSPAINATPSPAASADLAAHMARRIAHPGARPTVSVADQIDQLAAVGLVCRLPAPPSLEAFTAADCIAAIHADNAEAVAAKAEAARCEAEDEVSEEEVREVARQASQRAAVEAGPPEVRPPAAQKWPPVVRGEGVPSYLMSRAMACEGLREPPADISRPVSSGLQAVRDAVRFHPSIYGAHAAK